MRFLALLTAAIFVLNANQTFAALNNGGPAVALNACSTGIAAGASCRATPTKYQVTIYEMGLCIAVRCLRAHVCSRPAAGL